MGLVTKEKIAGLSAISLFVWSAMWMMSRDINASSDDLEMLKEVVRLDNRAVLICVETHKVTEYVVIEGKIYCRVNGLVESTNYYFEQVANHD